MKTDSIDMKPQEIKHRDHWGPAYKGIAIHSLSCLHELVGELVKDTFKASHPILELGAGSGALCLRMLDSGFTVVPVDLDGSDWSLDVALMEADFNQDLWYEETFQGRRFHQIVALEVIEHLENPCKFLHDISLLLEDGGYLIMSTPNVVSFHSVYAALKKGEFFCFSPVDCISSGHISILPWWLLKHLASRQGLEVVRCIGVGDLPMGFLRKLLVHLLMQVRSIFFRPDNFEGHEGLSLVCVFKKAAK